MHIKTAKKIQGHSIHECLLMWKTKKRHYLQVVYSMYLQKHNMYPNRKAGKPSPVKQSNMASKLSDMLPLPNGKPCPGASGRHTLLVLSSPLSKCTSFIACNSPSHLSTMCVCVCGWLCVCMCVCAQFSVLFTVCECEIVSFLPNPCAVNMNILAWKFMCAL